MFEKYSVIFLILASFCLCHNETNESWYKHSQYVHNFKCQHPQARSFEIPELFEPDDPLVIHMETVYPSTTVLHRCENAGCCAWMKVCVPKETEVVHLIFGIVEPGDSKVEYVYKDVVNHTSCTCERKKIDSP